MSMDKEEEFVVVKQTKYEPWLNILPVESKSKISFASTMMRPQIKARQNTFFTDIAQPALSNEAVLGLAKIFTSPRKSIKLFWSLSLIVANGLNSYFVIASILTYLKFDVSTSVEYVTENPSVFPKVTFCNNNQFTTAYASNFIKTLNEQMDSSINIFNESKINALNYSLKESWINVVYNAAIAKMLSKNVTDEERKQLGHSLDDILFR